MENSAAKELEKALGSELQDHFGWPLQWLWMDDPIGQFTRRASPREGVAYSYGLRTLVTLTMCV